MTVADPAAPVVEPTEYSITSGDRKLILRRQADLTWILTEAAGTILATYDAGLSDVAFGNATEYLQKIAAADQVRAQADAATADAMATFGTATDPPPHISATTTGTVQ